MRPFEPEPDLSERIHDSVLDAICSGELKAGARITQEELANRFGVSRQPVLQAKMLLRSRGIEFEERNINRGYSREQLLEAVPGARTVPQIFLDGELVGGLFYHNYPGGTGLTAGAVFGRIAGNGAGSYVKQ